MVKRGLYGLDAVEDSHQLPGDVVLNSVSTGLVVSLKHGR